MLAPINNYFMATGHSFCVKCGNKLPPSNTVNYCPNCGQAIVGASTTKEVRSPLNTPSDATKGEDKRKTGMTLSKTATRDLVIVVLIAGASIIAAILLYQSVSSQYQAHEEEQRCIKWNQEIEERRRELTSGSSYEAYNEFNTEVEKYNAQCVTQ